MRATDERKGEGVVMGGGGQTVGTERSSKQRAGHLITERVLLQACNRLTGSPLSPLDCACTEWCSQDTLGLWTNPIGQLESCWTLRYRDVVRFLKACLRFSYTSWLAAWQRRSVLLTLKGTQTVHVVLLRCSLRKASLLNVVF